MLLCVFCLQFILFIAVLELTESRKYDVEVEALKLYGEDIHSVLQRFRKTPDYLKILNEKMSELNQHYEFIAMQTLSHYTEEMKNKISESLGLEKFQPIELTTTSTSSPSFYRGHQNYRRDDQSTDDEMSPVEILDTHKVSTILTFSERNSFRDLGFKYAGHVIHAIIKHMGSDDQPVKSTRQPYEGDHDSHQKTTTTTTTAHEHVHEVTSSPEAEQSTSAAETSIADSFKYRYSKPRK